MNDANPTKDCGNMLNIIRQPANFLHEYSVDLSGKMAHLLNSVLVNRLFLDPKTKLMPYLTLESQSFDPLHQCLHHSCVSKGSKTRHSSLKATQDG